MATQTKPRPASTNLTDGIRKASIAYLDGYEKVVDSLADSQAKLAVSAEGGPAPWLGEVLTAQAELTREAGKLVSAPYRRLLK